MCGGARGRYGDRASPPSSGRRLGEETPGASCSGVSVLVLGWWIMPSDPGWDAAGLHLQLSLVEGIVTGHLGPEAPDHNPGEKMCRHPPRYPTTTAPTVNRT